MANRDWKGIAVWVVSIVVGLAVFVAGLDKFLHEADWKEDFEGWGYPGWFSLVTGVLEMAGGLGLVLPWTRAYGGALAAAAMAGAVVTRVVHGEWVFVVAPLLLGMGAGWVAWVRCPAWALRWVGLENRGGA